MKPKRTILCVDDNEQSLSHRKIVLETRGYRVASFTRGEDALARFLQGGVDLVGSVHGGVLAGRRSWFR